MTATERQERAAARKAARTAQWETERADRAAIADALRDVVRDKAATPAQRLFAIAVLDYMGSYHIVPSRLQYPDSVDDSDVTARLRERFAEIKAAENNT